MECLPNVLEKNYNERLWLVFVREWTRATLGQSQLQIFDDGVRAGKPVKIPGPIHKDIEDCIAAMAQGGNVVPGIRQKEGVEQIDCYQSWMETACFARWYMQSLPEAKAKIREVLASGNAAPWTVVEGGEDGVRPCTSENIDTPCCPADVWTDPAYLKMDEAQEDGGWSIWKIVLSSTALGLGAALVRKVW